MPLHLMLQRGGGTGWKHDDLMRCSVALCGHDWDSGGRAVRKPNTLCSAWAHAAKQRGPDQALAASMHMNVETLCLVKPQHKAHWTV